VVTIFVLMRLFFKVYSSHIGKKYLREKSMKLKTLAQVLLLSGSFLALAGCSSMHHSATDTADGGPGDGVQASGAGGEGDGFGTAGMTPEQLLAKHTYYFDFDSSNVNDNEKPAIFANATYLPAHPNSKILLEGHTDPRGSREYNVALGERRANSVADLLKSKGVNADQIRVISYGAERLAVAGHSDEDYRRDRRVVLVYLQH
jgi:peptidoglycan-associated lipoprotein